MIDKAENPAEIYLITDTEGDLVWCDTPAPGEGMREEDATRYVREDIYLALQAQVKQLRNGLNQAIELLVTALVEPQQITDSEISELRDIEQATPTQCLAEIKAQAGRDGFVACYFSLRKVQCGDVFDLVKAADEYANQIRQQAAKAGE